MNLGRTLRLDGLTLTMIYRAKYLKTGLPQAVKIQTKQELGLSCGGLESFDQASGVIAITLKEIPTIFVLSFLIICPLFRLNLLFVHVLLSQSCPL